MTNRIKAVREALHMTQADFGERLGVSRDVIGNLEYGRVEPKDHFLRHLCQQYGVSRAWLDTGRGEMFLLDPERAGKLREAAELFQALEPRFQDYALELIRGLAKLQE